MTCVRRLANAECGTPTSSPRALSTPATSARQAGLVRYACERAPSLDRSAAPTSVAARMTESYRRPPDASWPPAPREPTRSDAFLSSCARPRQSGTKSSPVTRALLSSAATSAERSSENLRKRSLLSGIRSPPKTIRLRTTGALARAYVAAAFRAAQTSAQAALASRATGHGGRLSRVVREPRGRQCAPRMHGRHQAHHAQQQVRRRSAGGDRAP